MYTKADEEAKLIGLISNYIILSQFELARAGLLDLYRLNSELALQLLNSIISNANQINGMLNFPTISRAHLIWLCVLELQSFTSQDNSLAFKEADFTLILSELTILFHKLYSNEENDITNTSEEFKLSKTSIPNFTKIKLQNSASSSKLTSLNINAEEFQNIIRLFSKRSVWGLIERNKIVNLGQTNFLIDFSNETSLDLTDSSHESPSDFASSKVKLDSIKELTRLAPDILCALSRNAYSQLVMENSERMDEEIDTPSSTSRSTNESIKQHSVRVKDASMQIMIENALIDLIIDLLKKDQFSEACEYLEYLNSDFDSVPSLLYSNMFAYFLNVLRKMEDDLIKSQSMLMQLHESAISSGSHYLVTLLESEEDKESKSTGNPLEKMNALICRNNDLSSSKKSKELDIHALSETYKRKMYHYARTNGKHVLACALDTALSAIEHLDFKKAYNVLIPYPKLCSVVAAMGWDLLSQNLEGRRNLMTTLWNNNYENKKNKQEDYYNCKMTFSMLGLQSPSSITYEASCIDNLCDELCYRLEMGYYAALYIQSSSLNLENNNNNTSFQNLHSKISSDNNFISGLVVENLAILSPIKVIFDVMPKIDVEKAIQLVLKQPNGGKSHFSNLKMWDVELLHMFYCIQLTVNVFSMKDIDHAFIQESSKTFLQKLEKHLSSIVTPMRKTWLIIFLVDLLQMDLSLHTSTSSTSSSSHSKSNENQETILTPHDSNEFNSSRSSESKAEISHPAIDFMHSLLSSLLHHIPSPSHEADKSTLILESMDEKKGKEDAYFPIHDVDDGDDDEENEDSERVSRYAWEKRGNVLRSTLKDWEWRLAILRRMTPSSNRSWKWNEILTVLLAAPSTLLHICVQRAQYALGEEAVQHFSLPTEEAVSLQLAEWVDDAVTRASVDGAISRVAKGSSHAEESLNLTALYSRLPPLASVILCLDVAVASARSSLTTNRLLDQAKSLLIKCESIEDFGMEMANNNKGKKDENINIHNAITFQVGKALLKQLQDIRNQGEGQSFQQKFCVIDYSHPKISSVREKPNIKYILSLQNTINDSIEGKSQFLSGKLHNFAKVFAGDTNLEENNLTISSFYRKNDNSKQTKKYKIEIDVGLQRYIPPIQNISSPQSPSASNMVSSTNEKEIKGEEMRKNIPSFSFFPPSSKVVYGTTSLNIHSSSSSSSSSVAASPVSSSSSATSSSSSSAFPAATTFTLSSSQTTHKETIGKLQTMSSSEALLNNQPAPPTPTDSPSSLTSPSSPSFSSSPSPTVEIPSDNFKSLFPALKFIVGTSSSVQKKFFPFFSPKPPPIAASSSSPLLSSSSLSTPSLPSSIPNQLPQTQKSPIPYTDQTVKMEPYDDKSNTKLNKKTISISEKIVKPSGQVKVVPNNQTTHPVSKPNPFLTNWKGLGNQKGLLSAFIHYVVSIGDIVDDIEETPNFNYFSLIYERPSDLLTRLVFSRQSASSASKIASIMDVDLVHQVISASVPPVYSFDQNQIQNKNKNKNKNKNRIHSNLYPLRLDVVKHLFVSSPVRAILACVFGTKKFISLSFPTSSSFGEEKAFAQEEQSSMTDFDSKFYEFAIDQSSQYPPLHRWIELQNQIMKFDSEEENFEPNDLKSNYNTTSSKMNNKRMRVDDEITKGKEKEDNMDDQYKSKKRNLSSSVGFCELFVEKRNEFLNENKLNYFFDWNNEGFFYESMEKEVNSENFSDALDLSDTWLENGAPDHLLQKLIDRSHTNITNSNLIDSQTHSPFDTWQLCLRMNDKELAALLALKHLENWDLVNAIETLESFVYTLSTESELYNEVLEKKKTLELFGRVMKADGRFENWIQVKIFCEDDPEGLALRMAEKGEVNCAVEIALTFHVRVDLRQELQGRQLSILMQTNPLQGGGSVEGIRYLHNLSHSEDCVHVVIAAISQLSSLHSKEVLVWYLINNWDKPLSEEDKNLLTRMALGLRMLHMLPATWQQWCNPIYNHPHLILETLLMSKQLQSAEQLLKSFPEIQNDSLILTYASKALIPPSSPPPSPFPSSPSLLSHASSQFSRQSDYPHPSLYPSHSSPFTELKRSVSSTSTHTTEQNRQSGMNLSNKELSMMMLWGGKDDSRSSSRKSKDFHHQSSPFDSPRGRKSSRFPHLESQKSDYVDAQSSSVDLSQEKWLLSGDYVKDENTRKSHTYKNIPNAALFESLINLIICNASIIKNSLQILIKTIKSNLVVEFVPLDQFFDTNVAPTLHAANTYHQALNYIRSLIQKIYKSNDSNSNQNQKPNQNSNSNVKTIDSPNEKKNPNISIQSPSNLNKNTKSEENRHKPPSTAESSASIPPYISTSMPFAPPSSSSSPSPISSLLSDYSFYEFVNQNAFNFIETAENQSYKYSIDLDSDVDFDLEELMLETDRWLTRVDLMNLMLSCGISVSINDFFYENVNALIDRLIREEYYKIAIIVCLKCQVNSVAVWKAWGQALLCIQKYNEARQKFEYALRLSNGEWNEIISHILLTLENAFPSDVNSARIEYNRVKQYVSNSLQDALSSESYLDLLAISPLYRIPHHPSLSLSSSHSPSLPPSPSKFHKTEYESSHSFNALNASKIVRYHPHHPHPHLDDVCYNEALFYLQKYAKQDMISFIFRHGQFMDACKLFFPPINNQPNPNLSPSLNQSFSFSSFSSASFSSTQPSPLSLSPKRIDPSSTEYGTLDDLCKLCIAYDSVNILEDVIIERMNFDQSASSSYKTNSVDLSSFQTMAALSKICSYFETHRHFHHLYRFQILQKDTVAAGLTCIQLFLNTTSFSEALIHLENAQMHFDEGRTARHLAGDASSRPRTGKGKSASAKLTEEELIKLKILSQLQMEVLLVVKQMRKHPYEFSLFGNPNESETIKRRCEVAEILVERNYDLAFQVITELGLPAVQIYAGVAASLAEVKRSQHLWEVLRSIRGPISDNDWDQVTGVAIRVYIEKHKERPDKLIEQLSSPHWKVVYYVACNRLKLAFQIASNSKNENDVLFVYNEARENKSVKEMCRQWLSSNNA